MQWVMYFKFISFASFFISVFYLINNDSNNLNWKNIIEKSIQNNKTKRTSFCAKLLLGGNGLNMYFTK